MSSATPYGRSNVGPVSPGTLADRKTHLTVRWPSLGLRQLAIGGMLLLAVSLAIGLRSWLVSGAALDNQFVFLRVEPSDLPINVVERGNLESQFNVQIYCEVDDISGDGIDGTPILWIVPNGSSVREGELLVEFDSSSHLERYDAQILDTERARAEQIQANVQFENQKSQNETALEDARLQVELAELELLMFQDEENGSFQLEMEEIERLIDDLNTEILAAEANLTLKTNELRGVESLFKLGYAGKSEVDRIFLDYLQAEGAYSAKMNRLKTQMASRVKKTEYEYKMQQLELKGKLDTAQRNLGQVDRNNEALLAKAKAAKDGADRALKKEEERLARYETQLKKCKIYAPQDGMVAYATDSGRYSRGAPIDVGALVRERQHILSLPNLNKMQVKTSVHESVQNEIRGGLDATIRLDAFPDRTYAGKVTSIAVLPEQTWMNDTKMYETVVTIEQDVRDLKPGMTAVVEIHVAHLQDVLCVPVQAVVQVKDQNWCYVRQGNRVERHAIRLGRTNDKFVEVLSGIDEGDEVVLNSMSVVDEQRDQKRDYDAAAPTENSSSEADDGHPEASPTAEAASDASE